MKRNLKLLILILTLFSFLQSCKKGKENWYCPMHPTYTSDKAGQCPICNMNLVKKEKIENSTSKSDTHSHHEKETTENKNSKTEDTLYLPEEKQRLIGIKTAKVEILNLNKKILAYSTVAYHPELYTAILEYRNPDELILGSKNGRAYIYSSIYESDIGYIKKGLKVNLKIDSFPDKTYTGTIQSVDSILDEKNRTLRFRSYVLDRDNTLKPQMFGNLEISIPLKKALSIPKSALLNTGKHKLAYKKVSNEEFTPVFVKTGMETDDFYEVLEGLKEGEEIVVESNFLLDSESKIKLGGSSNEHSH